MQIRNKHTGQEIGGSYLYWIENILSKHVEENYEILTHPDLVDVFEINTQDGSKNYIDTIDRYIAKTKYLEKSDRYTIVNTTAKFDSVYRMTKRPKGTTLDMFPGLFELSDLTLTNEINMKQYTKIFISHSSLDKEIVSDLIEMLELIGVKSENIFCSSIQGYGVSLGEDFLQRIKDELNEKTLVLFVLSENFYQSPVCLCEMGATWIKTTKHIPILIPPFNYSQIKGVINNIQGLKIDEPLQINELKREMEIAFDLKMIDLSKWEARRDKLLSNIKSKITPEYREIN